jgi:formate dehydrogenase iron-sulfur subunit
MTISAFLTDATLCIGCKACEVACKEWNEVPADGMVWSGLSYDNTQCLGASISLGFSFRRLQALRECGMPGSLSHGVNHAHRRWIRSSAEGRMQWLRILRGLLSVWRD